jgi:transcriptional regulator with XRE-family HTH domain
MRGRATDRIAIPASLWDRAETLEALRARDIRRLFHLLRQYAGISQTKIAIACGMTQGKVSGVMKAGGSQVLTLEVFERIADGLDMPDDCRMTLGLAPRSFHCAASQNTPPPVVIRPRDDSPDLATSAFRGSLDVDLPDDEEDEDPVRRRTFTRLTGAGLFSAILADLPDSGRPLEGVEAFAAALAGHSDLATNTSTPGALTLDSLGTAVANAKRDYQACRYSTVIDYLPGLLADLRMACETYDGDALLTAHALYADAHHVAASILLKLDDEGLAWIAADRSMRGARLSQDPTIIGSSARIITHALMNDGHLVAATRTASRFAELLDRDMGTHTPDSLSVYGALLLRGAVAAGQGNDRHTAQTLLDEATGAGERLGGDYNLRWTAFGPTNVQLHRVNIAMLLGDAGAAVKEARSIDLDRILITERKASLLVDTSRAFAQWGKHDKAYEILRAAHHLAPEEISARPSVHRMLRDLLTTAPPSIRRQIREFTAQIGVRV